MERGLFLTAYTYLFFCFLLSNNHKSGYAATKYNNSNDYNNNNPTHIKVWRDRFDRIFGGTQYKFKFYFGKSVALPRVSRIGLGKSFKAVFRNVERRIDYDLQLTEARPRTCRREQIGVGINRRLISSVYFGINGRCNSIGDARLWLNRDFILIPMLMYGKVSQENYVELTAASAIPNKEIKSPQILRY